jgi:hypothetical protein
MVHLLFETQISLKSWIFTETQKVLKIKYPSLLSSKSYEITSTLNELSNRINSTPQLPKEIGSDYIDFFMTKLFNIQQLSHSRTSNH